MELVPLKREPHRAPLFLPPCEEATVYEPGSGVSPAIQSAEASIAGFSPQNYEK